MNRQEFLRLCGLFGITHPLTTLGFGCKKEDNPEPKGKNIVVVGAGISGLAAAKKLQANGFEVLVLEAQEKVGGRLCTNRSLGVAFDEGASWIHGLNGNPLTGLAEEAGMTTFEVDDDSFLSYDLGGVLRTDAQYDDTEDEFYAILENLYNSGNASQSFEEVFNNLYPAYANDRLWKFLLSAFLTFDTGDLSNLSSLYYYEGEEFGSQESIATNGYDTLAMYLANGLSVQLNQKVTKIDYTEQKLKVTHNGTLTEADYVLVTVPLGVLKAEIIEFLPALLPEKQNAIEKVGMNCVNKFFLIWDTVFWDDEQYISYTPDIPDKFNYFVNINKFHPAVNALLTFAYADYGRQTESMTDNEIIEEIMVHLRDIYGNDIPNPTNLLRTKWQTNEYSFGSYSYTAVETEMEFFDDLAKSIDNRLFFAGEHTHRVYFSTAHGAYLSGLREADKIIDL